MLSMSLSVKGNLSRPPDNQESRPMIFTRLKFVLCRSFMYSFTVGSIVLCECRNTSADGLLRSLRFCSSTISLTTQVSSPLYFKSIIVLQSFLLLLCCADDLHREQRICICQSVRNISSVSSYFSALSLCRTQHVWRSH